MMNSNQSGFCWIPRKILKKFLEVGYSINGYDVLPKHSDIDISRALRKEFFEESENDLELISLRLILFFELRSLHWAWEVKDEHYESLNKIIESIRLKLEFKSF